MRWWGYIPAHTSGATRAPAVLPELAARWPGVLGQDLGGGALGRLLVGLAGLRTVKSIADLRYF